MENATKTLLTTTEAAEYLGLSLSTITNSRYTGLLGGTTAPKFRKIGKSIRYSVESLSEWISQFEEQTNTSQTAA